MTSKYSRLLLATALVFLASVCRAATEDDCKGPSSECVPVGGWDFSIAIGAGVRTDPVVHESTIPLIVIPHISYYGEHFFLDDLDLGYSFIDSDRSNLSLIATPGYDRVYFYRSDLQNIFVTGFTNFNATGNPSAGSGGNNGSTSVPVKKPFPWHTRSVTYLAGPEWTFKLHGVSGQLDVLHEITGHNHGDEVRAALGIPLSRKINDWNVNVGLTWKSSAIVNYYYGAPGVYQVGSALDPFVKLGYSHPLKGKWKVTGFVECERLSNAIADSPIVNARFVTTAFVGTVYSF
jgi:outer membrane protein